MQIATKIILRLPTFLWAVTVSPTALFYFWFRKVYGEATRIIVDNIKDQIQIVLDYIKVGLLFFTTNTKMALGMIWHFVWVSFWISTFDIIN
jgi:hypothetical protein